MEDKAMAVFIITVGIALALKILSGVAVDIMLLQKFLYG